MSKLACKNLEKLIRPVYDRVEREQKAKKKP